MSGDVEIIDPPKKRTQRTLLPSRGDETSWDEKRRPVVEEGLKILDPKRETFEERQTRLEGQRTPYAAMVAHQELAALVLAAGGTTRQAAAKAGVSKRQVKKYMESADFRQRIEEFRQQKFSKIAGRVLKELEKRTDPKAIKHIDLLDLLRVFDRMYGDPRKSGGGLQIGELNVTNNNYNALIQALLDAKPGDEGTSFPRMGPEDLRLPGKSSPVEG